MNPALTSLSGPTPYVCSVEPFVIGGLSVLGGTCIYTLYIAQVRPYCALRQYVWFPPTILGDPLPYWLVSIQFDRWVAAEYLLG